MNEYYIYIHLGYDDKVLYVGKGSGRRAYNWANRKYPKDIVRKIVILPMRYTDEKLAYEIEELITQHYKDLGQCEWNNRIGTSLSEETKEKMSKNHANYTGENNPMYGKHLSEETKKKIRESNPNTKKVKCLETGEVFSTITEASKWCGSKNGSNIIQQIKGVRKSAGKHPITKEKLHWEYVDKNSKEE